MSRTPQYPRAAPYQPPQQSAGDLQRLEARLEEAGLREARLRRWMLLLAGGTLAFVMVTVALGVFLVIRSVQRTTPPVVEAKVEPPREKMQPAPPEQQPLMPREPAQVPREQPLMPRERSLEAVGGFSAAHLYQSYLDIGLLADAAENDVYSDADAKKLLVSILAWIDSIDMQLNRLAESGIEAEDQKNVTQVRRLAALLRTQGRELRAYWDAPENDVSGKKEHETKFHQSREEAWSGIKDLLGIKDE